MNTLELLTYATLMVLAYQAWLVIYSGVTGKYHGVVMAIPTITYVTFFNLMGYLTGSILFMAPLVLGIIGTLLFFAGVSHVRYHSVRNLYLWIIRIALISALAGGVMVGISIGLGDVGIGELITDSVFYMWLSSTIYIATNLKR